MLEALKQRLQREKAARRMAEELLEQKSLELHFKNEELRRLNQELNTKLDSTSHQLTDLSNEHLVLFENSGVGVALTFQGEIIRINKTFANMLGYEKNEIVGKTIGDISYIDDIEESLKLTQELHQHKQEKKVIQKRYKIKNGSFFWASTHVSDIQDENGKTKYHLAIIVNIHKEKIAKTKLKQSYDQLKEINENLDSFAHIVSHDLKAPLTGINTVLGWVKDKELDDELSNYINLMQDRVSKMYKLIEGIIQYSKTTQSDQKKELFSVEKLIDETILLHEIPLHINISKEGNFPHIYTNKAKLTHVFTNLIDNAIKFNNKPKGVINITCSEDEKFYIFKVYDNGIGIDSKHYSKIFKIFNSLTQNTKNSGIGLSLVKKIIEQYDGKIGVNSTPREFTEFTFNIAKQKVQL